MSFVLSTCFGLRKFLVDGLCMAVTDVSLPAPIERPPSVPKSLAVDVSNIDRARSVYIIPS